LIGRDRPPPATPLEEAIAAYIKRAGLKRRLDQASVIPEWAELVGPQTAAVTTPHLVTQDGALIVSVDPETAWPTRKEDPTDRVAGRVNAGPTGRRGRDAGCRWPAQRASRGGNRDTSNPFLRWKLRNQSPIAFVGALRYIERTSPGLLTTPFFVSRPTGS
jgi:hypothetical protein